MGGGAVAAVFLGGLVERDLHRDRPRLVHAAQRDHAPAVVHHPAQEQLSRVALQQLFAQPLLHPGKLFDRELRSNFGALRSRAHLICVGALAERQTERVDQDRLARPGLSSERGKAGPELKLEGIDHGEIADGKMLQHDPGRCA